MVRSALFFFLAAPAVLALHGTSPLHKAAKKEDIVAGRYLVKVDQTSVGIMATHVSSLARSYGASAVQVSCIDFICMCYPFLFRALPDLKTQKPTEIPAFGIVGLTLTAEELLAVRNEPSVAFVEEVQIYQALGYRREALSWGIDRINQVNRPLNWDSYFETGSNVVDVYILGRMYPFVILIVS